MTTSTLFESEHTSDIPVWTGVENGTIIELFNREETGAEEIYAAVEGTDVVKAAVDLATFLEDQPIDGVPFGAHVDPQDPTTIIITVQDKPYTSYSIERDEDTKALYIATDLQLDDDELEFLIQNGVLPSYSDEDLDIALADVGDDEDFWEE